MQLIRKITGVVFVIAILASLLPFIIEPRYEGSIPEGHDLAAALAILFALIGVGAGVLFALGLNGFKTGFKRAYAYVCTGMVLHGLSMLAFPILFMFTSLYWTDLPNLLGDGPYLVGTILVFLGLIYFSRLLSLRSWVQNFYVVVPLALGLTLAAWLLPHASYEYSELQFNLVKSILSLECIFSLLSLPLLWKLRQTASFIYTKPLLWLTVAVATNFVAGAVYALVNYVRLPQEQSAMLYELMGTIYAVTQLLFLIAGYSFNRITRSSELPVQRATPFDVITYVAGLASDPRSIDPLLEPFRVVTANYNPAQSLDPATSGQLTGIYNSLEEYLITQESVRSFTREGIRQTIQNKFAPEAYSPFFQPQTV